MLFFVSSLFIWECLLFANYITNGFQRGTQAILKHLRSRIPGTLLQRISVCIWITICRNIAKVAIVEHASILETIGNTLDNNRAFAWWRHLTTTTRMLWGKLLYSVFFFCEESLVRDTNLHNKDCSEMHSGSCSQMTSSWICPNDPCNPKYLESGLLRLKCEASFSFLL